MTKKEFSRIRQPSALLRLALDDLTIVENDSRYQVNMGHFHLYQPKGDVCFVCLAGAILAVSLKTARKSTVPVAGSQLVAIDRLREGQVVLALEELDHPRRYDEAIERQFCGRSLPRYSDSPQEFREAVEALIIELKNLDL